MARQDFIHVRTWVFDLDNTLYPPEARLFDQIETRMTEYVMNVLGVDKAMANDLRHRYWREHGTTLSGLMDKHDIDPEPYLAHVHEIDLSHVAPAPPLRAAIDRLPGRKIIHTNGSRRHAERVSQARGLAGSFDAIYGIEDAGYAPKPKKDAYDAIRNSDGYAPDSGAMFDDDERNLEVPLSLGMRTVHVSPVDSPTMRHHQTKDLAGFLLQLT